MLLAYFGCLIEEFGIHGDMMTKRDQRDLRITVNKMNHLVSTSKEINLEHSVCLRVLSLTLDDR